MSADVFCSSWDASKLVQYVQFTCRTIFPESFERGHCNGVNPGGDIIHTAYYDVPIESFSHQLFTRCINMPHLHRIHIKIVFVAVSQLAQVTCTTLAWNSYMANATSLFWSSVRSASRTTHWPSWTIFPALSSQGFVAFKLHPRQT